MKDKFDKGNHRDLKVAAPLVGAWIEMLTVRSFILVARVAPFVGAWIEISVIRTIM